MPQRNRPLLIIGGHFTPAWSIVQKLQEKGYSNLIWVGHSHTMLGDKEFSSEYNEVTQAGIPFYPITTGKLYRYPSFKGILSLLRIPIGFVQSFSILSRTRPSLIISFGGYIAIPICISGWLLGIPIVTHEQTSVTGLSNKVISFFAKKIFISWNTSFSYFPKSKTIFTGNPVRKELFETKKPYIDFQNEYPIIYVTGGNQGSHIINMTIKEALPELTKKYNIIHQCGANSITNDYATLKSLEDVYPHYKVEKNIWGNDIGEVLHQATIVIGRSGANTVYELALLRKPSILIPLPFARHQEQLKNAQILASLGLGTILLEEHLNAQSLIEAVTQASKIANTVKDPIVSEQLNKRIDKEMKKDAAEDIVKEITNLLSQ